MNDHESMLMIVSVGFLGLFILIKLAAYEARKIIEKKNELPEYLTDCEVLNNYLGGDWTSDYEGSYHDSMTDRVVSIHTVNNYRKYHDQQSRYKCCK